jgi:RES domain
VVPLAGVWCRHVRGEQLAGLYLAQDPDTVWAEWYRPLAELGLPPDTRLPRDLWRFSVNLQRVADVSRRAALRAIGLPEPRPDRAQWPVFQDVGAQLAVDGFQGVLFRSSARPAGLCVCVFASDDGFRGVVPAGSPERIFAAPVPPRGMRT